MKHKSKAVGVLFRSISLVVALCCLIPILPAFASTGSTSGIQTGVTENGKIIYTEVYTRNELDFLLNVDGYDYSGGNTSVKPIPSADKPSFVFEPNVKGGQFLFDVNMPCEDIVIDTSIRIDGTPNSLKRIFTLVDQTGGDYIVFGTMDTSKRFKLSDGTVICTMTEGVFYNITYIIKNTTRTYDVMLNGTTVAPNKRIPNENFDSVQKFRFQISDIGSNPTEKIYMNYVRAYASNKVLTDEELEKVIVKKNVYVEPRDNRNLWASKEEVSAAMEGNILLYIGKGKAAVGDEIKNIDDGNPNAVPFNLNDTIMVPLKFLSENLGASAEYNGSSAKISYKDHVINLTTGSNQYTLDGVSKTFPEAPIEKDGITYVPLREVFEGLGTKVFWDKVGYAAVGDTVDQFNMGERHGRHVIFEAIRPAVFEWASEEEIIEDFNKNSKGVHPRVLLNADRVAEMKQLVKTDPIMKDWFNQLIYKADAAVTSPLTTHGRSDGVRMNVGTAVNYITNTAFAFLLTGEAQYKDRAIEEMLNVSAFPDWNAYHFLDASEMSGGVGLGYDWLYNDMTPEQRKTIEEGLVKHALTEILRDYDDDLTRERTWRWCHRYAADGKTINSAYVQNWVAVCGGSQALAALAVGDEQPELMAEVINKTFPRMTDLLFAYGPDGGVFEGISYWHYACQYIAKFSAGLSSVLGSDYGMFDLPGVGPLMYFNETTVAPTGLLNFDYADSSAANAFQLLWAAKRLNDPLYGSIYFANELVNVRGSMTVPSMIWYDPNGYDPNYKARRHETYIRDIERVSMTTQGYGDNDMFIGFIGRSGSIGQQHGGSFILDALDVRWSRDPGKTPEMYYTNAQMDRTGYYNQRAEGHSTLVINPNYGNQQARFKDQIMEKVEYGFNKRFAICNMTPSYEFVGASKVRRGIMMDNARQYAHIRDEVKSYDPMNFYWFMQIADKIDVDISEDGKTTLLTKEGKRFVLKILTEGDEFKFTVGAAVPLDESPQPTDAVSQGNAKRLAIHVEGLSEINLDVAMMPLAGDQTTIDYSQEIIPLDEWEVDNASLTTPTLTGINVDGVPLEGFSPDTYVYELENFAGEDLPEVTATCADGYRIESVDPVYVEGSSYAVGKYTVINESNENERRIYYVMFKLNVFLGKSVTASVAAFTDSSLPANTYAAAKMVDGIADGRDDNRYYTSAVTSGSTNVINFNLAQTHSLSKIKVYTQYESLYATKYVVEAGTTYNNQTTYKKVAELTHTPTKSGSDVVSINFDDIVYADKIRLTLSRPNGETEGYMIREVEGFGIKGVYDINNPIKKAEAEMTDDDLVITVTPRFEVDSYNVYATNRDGKRTLITNTTDTTITINNADPYYITYSVAAVENGKETFEVNVKTPVTNVALNKEVTASHPAMTNQLPVKAITDGSYVAAWVNNNANVDRYVSKLGVEGPLVVDINLGAVYKVGKADLVERWQPQFTEYQSGVKIETGLTDRTGTIKWTTVKEGFMLGKGSGIQISSAYFDSIVEADKLRVTYNRSKYYTGTPDSNGKVIDPETGNEVYATQYNIMEIMLYGTYVKDIPTGGGENVALYKPVTANLPALNALLPVKAVTDGSYSGAKVNNEYYDRYASQRPVSGPLEFVIDLGKVYSVYKANLVDFHNGNGWRDLQNGVKIEAGVTNWSNGEVTWETVKSGFKFTDTSSVYVEHPVLFDKEVNADKIRVTYTMSDYVQSDRNSDTYVSYNVPEIMVYGDFVKDIGGNILAGCLVESNKAPLSSVTKENNITDGISHVGGSSTANRFVAKMATPDESCEVVIHLNGLYDLEGVKLFERIPSEINETCSDNTKIEVGTTINGVTAWTTVKENLKLSGNLHDVVFEDVVVFDKTYKADKIRITLNSTKGYGYTYGYCLTEVEAFGSKVEDTLHIGALNCFVGGNASNFTQAVLKGNDTTAVVTYGGVGDGEEVTAVIAIYDANGMMIDMKYGSISGNTTSFTFDRIDSGATPRTMKLFTWNNMDNIKPLLPFLKRLLPGS